MAESRRGKLTGLHTDVRTAKARPLKDMLVLLSKLNIPGCV